MEQLIRFVQAARELHIFKRVKGKLGFRKRLLFFLRTQVGYANESCLQSNYFMVRGPLVLI